MDRMTLLKRVDKVLTYDAIRERLEGLGENPRYEPIDLGSVVYCVRKLFREAVEMTDEEFEELSKISAEDLLRWAENGKVD